MKNTAKLEVIEEQAFTVTDSTGRVFTLKEPSVLAPYDLVEAVGVESAHNDVYMSMVFPLLYLTQIDGQTVMQPQKKIEIRALIQRLGHHGVKALRAGVEEHFGIKNEEAEKEAIKK